MRRRATPQTAIMNIYGSRIELRTSICTAMAEKRQGINDSMKNFRKISRKSSSSLR